MMIIGMVNMMNDKERNITLKEYWINEEKIIRIGMKYDMKRDEVVADSGKCSDVDRTDLKNLLLSQVYLLKKIHNELIDPEIPLDNLLYFPGCGPEDK